jgi:hypothetical protein
LRSAILLLNLAPLASIAWFIFPKGRVPRKWNEAMSTTPFIYLAGVSGASYGYWIVDQPRVPSGLLAVGGNYAFLKKLANGNWLPIYVGQAANLQDRLPNHERFEDAVRAGATLVVAHSTPNGEPARLAEEKDLVAKWNPVLNVHHRTVG